MPRQFWPTSEPMQINLPGPQSKYPQAPDKDSGNSTFFLTMSKKQTSFYVKRSCWRDRKVKTISVNPSKTQTAMDLQQNCPCSQSPPLNYNDCEGRCFITILWLNSLLFGLGLGPPSVLALLPRINHEPRVEIKHCSSTTKME